MEVSKNGRYMSETQDPHNSQTAMVTPVTYKLCIKKNKQTGTTL